MKVRLPNEYKHGFRNEEAQASPSFLAFGPWEFSVTRLKCQRKILLFGGSVCGKYTKGGSKSKDNNNEDFYLGLPYLEYTAYLKVVPADYLPPCSADWSEFTFVSCTR